MNSFVNTFCFLIDVHTQFFLFIYLSTKVLYYEGHIMKNVSVNDTMRTPKVDHNKRFLKMVRINLMLDDGGG